MQAAPSPLGGELGTGVLHHVEVVRVFPPAASAAASTASATSLTRHILAAVKPLEIEANSPTSWRAAHASPGSSASSGRSRGRVASAGSRAHHHGHDRLVVAQLGHVAQHVQVLVRRGARA